MRLILESSDDNLPLFQSGYDLLTAYSFYRWWYKVTENNFHIVKNFDTFTPEKGDIFSGSVEFIQKGLSLINYNFPDSLNIHLNKFSYRLLKRKIWTGTRNDFQVNTFIKPLKKVKLFTGGVFESKMMFDLIVPETDDILLFSEPIEILSEYRCWILNNKILDIRLYSGNWKYFPNPEIVELAVKEFTAISDEIAYTIDFGVNSEGTFIIELNDVFGTGTYGFDTYELLDVHIKRYKQFYEYN